MHLAVRQYLYDYMIENRDHFKGMRTPVFSSGIAALRRRNPDERLAQV